MAIASLVLSIIAVILAALLWTMPIAWVLGGISLILAIIALRSKTNVTSAKVSLGLVAATAMISFFWLHSFGVFTR